MFLREILSGVYYTGVNDRKSERFEGLWPLPYGVSYNSYLIQGSEKIALIDTVEAGFIKSYINSILRQINGKKVDYLVVNHMEPDHSAGIPAVVDLFPDIKIIGNRQTVAMIKGYYHLEDKYFLEIKDNEEVGLGGKTMKFLLTPMVHWPETMMTYLKEENMLFSGDAFGTFGALNGGIIDKDLELSIFYEEAYRYYSNIVGKYGVFVQKALQKTSNLPISYICPTHGPVWHEELEKIIKIYDTLSKYEGEKGVTLIYGSMYGNTAEIAEFIAAKLNDKGIKKIKVYDAARSEMSYMISDAFRYKALIVGSPTYSMRLFPPIEAFMSAMETREIKNKILATFGSYTWSSAAGNKLKEYAERMKLEIDFNMEMKHSPTEEDFSNAEKLAEEVAKRLTD